ncbi:hypothetical protein [Salinivirga cyanobacteriivorans]
MRTFYMLGILDWKAFGAINRGICAFTSPSVIWLEGYLQDYRNELSGK